MTDLLDLPAPVLVAVAALVVSVLAAAFAERLGAPVLLLFLAVGMLLGEDGPGGIDFDNAVIARDIGLIALAVILFEGGFTADARTVWRVAVPAGLLATVGVGVTAGVVGLAAHVLLDLRWEAALLLGAVVSSTDAAAVFSAVRGLPLRRRLESVLEAESGVNDPVAVLLVILLVEVALGASADPSRVLTVVLLQAVGGVVGGLVFGRATALALNRLPLPGAGLYPVAAVAAALACFVTVTSLGGSGLLATYLLGLQLGSARIPYAGVVHGFLQGGAWLAQIGLFVLLGLFVDPSELLDDGPERALVALVLVLAARPLAVLVSLGPLGLPWRENAFVAWAGLRGAVPIVLATVPISAGVEEGREIFETVFYVVVASVVVQGLGLRTATRILGVVGARRALRVADLDATTLQTLGADVVELDIYPGGVFDGQAIRDLPLQGAVVVAVRRGDAIVLPRGDTVLQRHDRVYLLLDRDRVAALEATIMRRETAGDAAP